MNKPESLDRVRVVLCNTSHPGNIGSAARAMKTMGLHSLYLVSPRVFPDAEADALASGAVDVLERAVVCESLDEALADVVFAAGFTSRGRGLGPEPLALRDAVPQVLDVAARGQKVALVFGSERTGLTNAELAKCQLLTTIPANPEYSSLNLAAAVQVACYELRCALLEAPETTEGAPLASLEEVERLFEHMERTLVAVDFINPRHPKRLMVRLRRLFGRVRLERDEAQILRGILKAVGQLARK